MKLNIRLCYKIFLITFLFINGLLIAALIFPTLSLLLKPAHAKGKRDALKKTWLKWFRGIVGLHIAREGEPLASPLLLVGNHISWLDIIVLGSLIPANFVAKSDILSWPVIGYLAKQAGTIFVRRGIKQQVQETAEQMIWLLKQDSAVIAFPEGTTTQGDQVLPFHASLFQPALLTRSAIQPVALHYLGIAKEQAPFIGENAFVPHLIKMLSLDKIQVRVVFLSAINTSGKNRHSVSNETRAAILESIAEHQKTAISKLKHGS